MFLPALGANADDLPVIRIGVPREGRPLSYLDPVEGACGFTPDLLRAAEKLGKFRVEIVCDYWKNNYQAFKEGRIDAVAHLSRDDSDRRNYYFSAQAARLYGVAYTRRDQPPVTSISQFRGKRLGVIAGTATHTTARHNPAWQATIVTYTTPDVLLAAVERGECDIALLNNALFSTIDSGHPVQKNIIAEIEHELHFGLRTGDLKNLLLINAALEELKRNGTYDRLHEKWVAPIQRRPIRWVDVRPYLLPAVGLMLAIVGLLGWQRQVNRRLKHQAAALRESEERYRTLFEGSTLPMWLYEPESLRIVAANAAANQGFGSLATASTGRLVSDLCSPEERELFRRQLQANAEIVGLKEWNFQREDGTACPVELLTQAVTYEGRPLRQAIAIDMSEKRRWQDQALRTQRLEALGTLASGIAHDLNNMLAPILFASPLLRRAVTNPEHLRHIETIEQSAERGASLVRQILGFSRVGENSRQLVQLKHVVREVIGVVSAALPKQIRLNFNLSPDAWPVIANPTQIHQVLLNLCINARDAMPHGGCLTITVANRAVTAAESNIAPGRWLLITVADDGVGIPPEVLPRIWDSFFTTKDAGRGTGLGLAIVRGIVTDHGGTVSVQSTVGRGSTFCVWLPADPEASSGSAEDRPQHMLAAGDNEAILIVEDNAVMRSVMAEVIEASGYRAICCADGIEAIAQYNARRAEVALVVSDLDMPNMNGLVLLSTLKRLAPRLPLILMSGAASHVGSRATLEEARTLADAIFEKPIGPDKLLAMIESLLKHRNRR